MAQFLRQLFYLLTRPRQERILQDELEFHREMLERDRRAQRVGNALRLREESRDAWGWLWLDDLRHDLVYGFRGLLRVPAFTFCAVAVLALGTGVNLAAFHLLNTTVFRPLPVRDPDTLARFFIESPGSRSDAVPYPIVDYLAQHNSVLQAVMAVDTQMVAFGREGNEQVYAKFVSANFLRELGAQPAQGRLFDETGGAESPVALLGAGFWQRRLGSDVSYLGSVVYINRKPATVIGIVPVDFTGLDGSQPDVWLLLPQFPQFVEGSNLLSDFRAGSIRMYGRLKREFTPRSTEQALLPVMRELHRQYPHQVGENDRLTARSAAYLLQDDLQRAQPQEMAVGAMAALLMLLILGIACANLGNLQLARSMAREREIAIRSALGATRSRVVRLLIAESFLLAVMGTLVGMGLSAMGFHLLVTFVHASGFFLFTLDYRLFLFAFVIALLATTVFGIAPALQATRALRFARPRGRMFIGAQIAASCVLLIVSGLLIRSIRQGMGAQLGFDFERVIAVDPQLSSHGYDARQAAAFWDNLRAQFKAIPGVQEMSLCTAAPFGTTVGLYQDKAGTYKAYGTNVEPGYFSVLSIPLRSGRTFLSGDKKDVVIIGEKLARTLWPGENPLGQSWFGGKYQVIGVAAPARTTNMRDADSTEVYFPATEEDLSGSTLLIKTALPPHLLLPQIQALAGASDSRLFPRVTTLQDSFQARLEVSQRGAQIVSALAVLAALLAAAGVYGQVSYSVMRRKREIGVRMALGAGTVDVLGSVIRQFHWPFAFGIVIGIGIAGAASILLRHELYGLSHLDPLSYGGAVALLLVLATVAALLPARQALRVDPIEVLRHD